MSNLLKKPYEISIWDDILVSENKATGITTTKAISLSKIRNTNASYNQVFREQKIAIIGSDTMSAPWRAVNPIFTQNVNGSFTLTFTMYAKYYDDDRDELLDNPFTKMMVNERKVKLNYDGDWYDLIIKNVQESSDNKTYMYTAKSLFVNELSKTGYDLVFDSKLENNLGTITYLAKQILDGSDWKLKDENDTIRQYKEEPLYLIKLTEPIQAKRMLNLPNEIGPTELGLESGVWIYGFYSSVTSKGPSFQFLYRGDLGYREYPKDDDRIILDTPNYYIENASVDVNGNFTFFNEEEIQVSNEYRGKRLVRKTITKYDPVLDKYVSTYNDGQIYGYTEFEYITSDTVRNYVTNPTNFTSTSGWRSDSSSGVSLMSVPPLSENVSNFTTYIKWTNDGGHLSNSCIIENRSNIKSFAKDEKYIAKIKYGTLNDSQVNISGNLDLKIQVASYSFENNKFVLKDIIFDSSGAKYDKLDGYFIIRLGCKKSITYNDLLNNNYTLFISSARTGITYCIQDLQFFKEVSNKDGIIYPNTTVTAETRTKYYYYNNPTNTNITKAEDIEFIYQDYSPANYSADYDAEYEKRRSIKASESNRFNLIQSLCETFECWAKFEIKHNKDTGEILLDPTDGRQEKWISFHEYIGKDNPIGFKYGINLKSIQRTLDSDAVASKLIVKNNSNEHAIDGFCTIARASENPSGENFLLDFSYYINQGLLDFEKFNNDLYMYNKQVGYLGYYRRLKDINKTVEAQSKELSELVSTTIPRLRSQYSVYQTSIESSNNQIINQKNQIQQTTGYSYEWLLQHPNDNWWKENNINSLMISTARLIKNTEQYEAQSSIIFESLNTAQEREKEINKNLEDQVKQKEALHAEFYKRYSRFIQEGSWISEDYIDDNLYYLDAESTLHTSSQPKVTYTINVIELSQVEGYELYNFKVGDKTFIEDTEFFGWIDIIHSTPYKEEVVVSEVKFALDDPSQNTITVKNYKTQFEDLFQRIAAVTTSVQFSTGEYQRAAAVVNPNGTLDVSAVQNSITNNAIVLSNSNNESVIWDDSGITTSSVSRPNEMVRIVGGGIFLSEDFGSTWSTGITGHGINANFLNVGQIDVNKVRVMNGSYPTFRWDTSGLSAYYFEENNGVLSNYSQSNFVRLDQYGLYGIQNKSNFIAAEPEVDSNGHIIYDENGNEIKGEKKIHKNSNFYLTWSGFGIKTDSGAMSITSKDELQVFANGKERIKIGTLDSTNKIYGMRLFDDNGKVTLETGSNGQLYLQKTIEIAPEQYANNSRTKIGPSVGYDKDGNTINFVDENGAPNSNLSYSKIFSVKNIAGTEETIAFYDNGLLEARNAKIKGNLEAGSVISGNAQIGEGGIEIGELSSGFNSMKGIDIASSAGTTFKMDAYGNVSPNSITFTIKDSGVIIEDNPDVKWYISNSLVGITQTTSVGTGISITIAYKSDDPNQVTVRDKFKNGQCYIYVEYNHSTKNDKNETVYTKYTAYRELNLIQDGIDGKPGADGQDAIRYEIESSEGFVINSSDATATTTTLTARLYRGNTELDPDGKNGWTYTWYDKTDVEANFDGALLETGKTITYKLDKFTNYTQIYFTVNTNTGGGS